MVYIVTDSQSEGRTMLVSVSSEEELNARLVLTQTQEIAGCITDSEIEALKSRGFTVITV